MIDKTEKYVNTLEEDVPSDQDNQAAFEGGCFSDALHDASRENNEEVSFEELKAFEEELCKDLPKFNIAATIMPAIWGPAHGSIITVLFYPMWVFVDDLIYSAYTHPSVMSILFTVIACAGIIAVSLYYGANAQRKAYIRHLTRGKTKEQWDSAQKKWAIAMVIVVVIALVVATWFNLTVRPTLG